MRRRRYTAFEAAIIYALVASVWIVASDAVVAMLPSSVAVLLELSKGLAFVGVTAVALYWIMLRVTDQTSRETHQIAGAERLLTQMVDAAPAGIFLVNDEGYVTYMNRGAEELTGRPAQECLGHRIEQLCGHGSSDNTSRLGDLYRVGFAEGIQFGTAESPRIVLARSAAVDVLHSEAGSIVTLVDMTDTARSNQENAKLLGCYKFVMEAVIALVRAGDERQLIEDLTRLAVVEGRFAGAWGMARPEGDGPEIVAQHGLGDRALEVSQRRASEIVEGKAEAEIAELGEGAILVRNDLVHDPTNPWYTAAEAEGLASLATVGVIGAGGTGAILTLFADRAGYFDSELLSLLQTLRTEVAFAVERLSLERRRLEAEESTGVREHTYRVLFESNPQPMWVYAHDTLGFLAVNDAAIRKYGYSREQYEQMTIADIRPNEEIGRLKETIARYETSPGFDDAGIWTHRDSSGREFPVHIYSHTIDWEGRPAQLVMALEVARVE